METDMHLNICLPLTYCQSDDEKWLFYYAMMEQGKATKLNEMFSSG